MTMSNGTQIHNEAGGLPNEKIKPSTLMAMGETWRNVLKVLLAEFVSTMLLIFLGCMTCVPLKGFDLPPPMYSPIGFGMVVLFNITAFGHISGAHMNPSVTLSAVIWGKVSIPLGIMYVVAQCGGAIAGYGLLLHVSPINASDNICVTQLHPQVTIYQGLVIEIVLSVALGFINCSVWDPVNKEKQDAIPLKFGFTIAALSLAGGPLTGASMNPARTLGPVVWINNWESHWIYWAGPCIGGAFAPLLYKFVWADKNNKEY